MQAFNASPSSFAPQYGGWCAYGMRFEDEAHGGWPWDPKCLGPPCDPVRGWAIFDGRLYCSIGPTYMQKFLVNSTDNILYSNK
eukprot:gene5846-2490_t